MAAKATGCHRSFEPLMRLKRNSAAFHEWSTMLCELERVVRANRGVELACRAVPGPRDSALKSTSEVGTGGPATRVIEADILPTSPTMGTHAGRSGEPIDYSNAFV